MVVFKQNVSAVMRVAAMAAVVACGCGADARRSSTPDGSTIDGPPAATDGARAQDSAGPSDSTVVIRDAAGPTDSADRPTSDAPRPMSDAPRPGDASSAFSTNRGDFGLAGPSRCAGSGLLACEDFESGVASTSLWTGRASVDEVHAARGTKAWHIRLATSQTSFLTTTKIFPAPNNTYFGRMFVYVTSLVTSAYTHWTMVEATGTGVPSKIRVGGQRDLWGVGSDAGPTGDWTRNDNDPRNNPRRVPLNEWMCIEWMHDGANNETRFYWDGVDHESLHTTATNHGYGNGGTATAPYNMPVFNRLQIGWAEYQTVAGGMFELWVDEIALDSQRIGCVR